MKLFRDAFRLVYLRIKEHTTRGWLILILAIGIILRVGVMVFVGEVRVPWQFEYEEIANSLIEHGQYYFSFYGMTAPHPTSFIPPVYPLFLAWGKMLWPAYGNSLVKVLQIIASELSILCIYALTREVGGSTRQGILTAFFWAIYPPAIAYASDLSTVTLETFFLISGIWLLIRAVKKQLPVLAIPAGILLSLAALTRSTWLVVLPLAVIWLTWYLRGNWTVWGKLILLFGLASGITLAPWVVHNYQIQGKWLLASTNGGLNFWIGNNPHATGEYIFPTGMDEKLVLSVANWSEVARDQFFYDQGFEFIRNSPREYISLLGHKLLYTIFFRPNIGSSYEAAHITMYNLSIISFVAAWLALIPFALLGLLHLGKGWHEHSFLFLILLGNVATSTLYFSGTRFRTPVDGLVIIWAVIGLSFLGRKWQDRRASRGKKFSHGT